MRKKIISAALFLVIAFTFHSCEPLNNCKICRQLRYDQGALIWEGPEREYCNTDLIAIETAQDVIIGNIRETWECR